MEHPIETVISAMIAYDAGDPMRIHHFLKVYAFARLIGLEEGLDPDTQFILETAAVVHDIGIHRAEAVYGSSHGKYQEELGPAEADALLSRLGWPRTVIDRVMFLVGHHHTYAGIDGADYQILVEADFLVNLYEDDVPPAARKHAYETIFKTETGRRLCRELYPAVCE
ncbi:MAG: HD domain-containing protein [Oscillospiraceae bacterium]|nr:HD domain-containing protein [Oscillospiraceae bacterium]